MQTVIRTSSPAGPSHSGGASRPSCGASAGTCSGNISSGSEAAPAAEAVAAPRQQRETRPACAAPGGAPAHPAPAWTTTVSVRDAAGGLVKETLRKLAAACQPWAPPRARAATPASRGRHAARGRGAARSSALFTRPALHAGLLLFAVNTSAQRGCWSMPRRQHRRAGACAASCVPRLMRSNRRAASKAAVWLLRVNSITGCANDRLADI